MSSYIFSHIFPFIYFFHKLKSLCQDNVNSYLKCTSIAAIFKWLTPRMVSTAKTARGSRTVHTPWAMINFDVKEGSEPNICWQPHLIRTSRNVNAFKVRGPTTSIATSSQMWSKELWYTSSTVCVWNWNLVREEVEASDEHVCQLCELCARVMWMYVDVQCPCAGDALQLEGSWFPHYVTLFVVDSIRFN